MAALINEGKNLENDEKADGQTLSDVQIEDTPVSKLA